MDDEKKDCQRLGRMLYGLLEYGVNGGGCGGL